MSQRAGRPHPEFQWIKSKNGAIPPNAVQGGYENDGKPLFVGRAMYKGSLIPGKAAPHFKGLLVCYDGRERYFSEYEVLVGDESLLLWKQCIGRLSLINWSPLEAGYEADGRELYIGKTSLENGVVVGKVGLHFANGLVFGYANKERGVCETEFYYVLAVPKGVSS